MITVFITKYALTRGIFKVDARMAGLDGSQFACYKEAGKFGQSFAHGNDWHFTEEAAKARAEEMRTKKLTSIRKQAIKLMTMTFDNIEVAKQ